jgi:hypothetical protein
MTLISKHHIYYSPQRLNLQMFTLKSITGSLLPKNQSSLNINNQKFKLENILQFILQWSIYHYLFLWYSNSVDIKNENLSHSLVITAKCRDLPFIFHYIQLVYLIFRTINTPLLCNILKEQTHVLYLRIYSN